MLGSASTQGARICLRCQLRLSRQAPRSSVLLPRRTAALSTSTRKNESSGSGQLLQPRTTRPEGDGKVIYKHIHPNGRIRGRRGKEVREGSAQLEVTSLGEPAEIILLSEAGFDRDGESKDKPPEDKQHISWPASESRTSQDILKAINEEKSTSTPAQADVDAHLNALWKISTEREDGSPRVLSESEAADLRNTLYQSYSHKQLVRYTVHFESRQTDPASGKQQGQAPHVVRSLWTVEHHRLQDRLPLQTKMLPTSRSKLAMKKATLVSAIVSRLWEIQVEDQYGEIEMHMQPWQSQILKAGNAHSRLTQIANAHGVNTTILEKYLRIRGTQRAATQAADAVQHYIGQAISRSFDLKPLQAWISWCTRFAPRFFTTEAVTRALSHLQVAVTHEQTKIVIYALDESSLEDAWSVLLRLLQVPSAGDCTRSLDTVFTKDLTFVPTEMDGQAFHPQRLDLERAILPINSKDLGEPDSSHALTQPAVDLSGTFLALDKTLQQSEFKITRKPRLDEQVGKTVWAESPMTTLSCVTGYDLHNSHLRHRKRNVPSATLPGIWERLFTPHAPYGLRTLSTIAQLYPDRLSSTPSIRSELRFALAPSPWASSKEHSFQSFPHVNLIFVDGDKSDGPQFSHWTAQLGGLGITVPLPHLAADLQFKRSSELICQSSGTEAMSAFTAQVKACVSQGGVLRAPLRVALEVPCLSLPHRSKNPITNHLGPYDWTAGPLCQMEYVSLGVEYRQTLEMHWTPFGQTSYPLLFTTVNGGKVGVNGSELSLVLPNSDAVDAMDPSAIEERTDFYSAAAELVSVVTAATRND